MENSSAKSCSACGSWWRLPLLLGLVLVAIVLSRGRGIFDNPPQADQNPAAGSPDADVKNRVTLSISFGNDRPQKSEQLSWHKGMTVADMLGKTPGIVVTQQDSGQSAFLTAIDGVANEGADGRNWTYAVNGENADRSFAVFELRPGDHVLWTFGPRP